MQSVVSTCGWALSAQDGIDSLRYTEGLPLATPKEDEVLVKIHAASLNAREPMIAKGGPRLELGRPEIVPGSDGAGVVEAVGSGVTSFRVGDRVCTHLTRGIAYDSLPLFDDITAGLGQGIDGTLRRHGVFHQSSLVKMPTSLDFMEAATLTCSGLTAWNALFGLEGRRPTRGDTVLVQGTGGVSVAALQFALAAGASVIATTSSDDKTTLLKSLGASHVLNYRKTPDWGAAAKALTPEHRGVDLVVDVGGPSTLTQSLAAVRIDGLIAAVGVLGGVSSDGSTHVPTVLDCIFTSCIARGLILGSKRQFDEMVRFVDEHGVRPVLDETKFQLSEVKEAYQFLAEGKHFSKVGIDMS